MRNLLFSPDAWEDFEYWMDHEPDKVQKIRELLQDCQRNPFKGIGKPEPLRHDLTGCWSRRISLSERMVYKVTDTQICILMLRYHYSK